MAAGAININAMNRGSVVSIGEISQPSWNQNGKTNFGNGPFYGANVEAACVTTLLDNDVFDNPIGAIEPTSSVQGQTL